MAAASPLLLGACGLPVGVSIASMVVDAISVAATEKTITDHGLSMVADKDCAMWRMVKGENICRNHADEADILMADAVLGGLAEPEHNGNTTNIDANIADTDSDVKEQTGQTYVAFADPREFNDSVFSGGAITAPAEMQSLEQTPAKGVNKAIEIEPVNVAAVTPRAISKPAPMKIDTEKTAPAKVQLASLSVDSSFSSGEGGIFYIIASYHRSADAEHFARQQTELNTQVLSGTARGKRVFRVAVGPVIAPERKALKRQLIKSGYKDAWALVLKKPSVIVEVASLN